MMKATKSKSSKRKKLEVARKKIKRRDITTKKKKEIEIGPLKRQIAINAMRQRNFPSSTQMRKEIANYSVTRVNKARLDAQRIDEQLTASISYFNPRTRSKDQSTECNH